MKKMKMRPLFTYWKSYDDYFWTSLNILMRYEVSHFIFKMQKKNDRIKFHEIWSKNIFQKWYDWILKENDLISRKYMNICFFLSFVLIKFTQSKIKYDPE